jgi:hypothetical protein
MGCSTPFPGNERKTFWVFDGFNGQVDIQIGPIKMFWVREFDIQNGADGRFFEPGKLRERHEELSFPYQ